MDRDPLAYERLGGFMVRNSYGLAPIAIRLAHGCQTVSAFIAATHDSDGEQRGSPILPFGISIRVWQIMRRTHPWFIRRCR